MGLSSSPERAPTTAPSVPPVLSSHTSSDLERRRAVGVSEGCNGCEEPHRPRLAAGRRRTHVRACEDGDGHFLQSGHGHETRAAGHLPPRCFSTEKAAGGEALSGAS